MEVNNQLHSTLTVDSVLRMLITDHLVFDIFTAFRAMSHM